MIRPHALVGAAALALAMFAVPSRTQDWPGFRGPNGSGVNDAVSPPETIDPGTEPAWRVEVPFGRSSPIVVGDTIVMSGSDADHLIVHAVHKGGQTAWTKHVARARQDDRYEGNDSASPTVASDGESIFAFFPELGVVAYGLDGEHRWTRELDAFDSFYGMSSSPVVAGGMVLLQCDQESGSYVLAIDAVSGEIVWRQDRPGIDPSWSTPVVRVVDGQPRDVVLFSSRRLSAHALEDGRELWHAGRLGSGPVCSPVVDGTRVFVSVPNHSEEPFPAFATVAEGLDKDKDGAITLAEVGDSDLGKHFGWVDDDEDGAIVAAEWAVARAAMMNKDYGLVAFEVGADGAVEELWRQRRSLPEIATPLVYRGVVYVLKHGGVLSALDSATGRVLRRARLGDEVVEDFNASPIAADGRLYLASSGGKILVVDAGAEWSVRSVHDIDEAIDATPAIGPDGALYVRSRQALYRFR